MADYAKTPAIRFAGFTDAWEQRKLSDLVERGSTFGAEKELPRVEYEDIISGTGKLNKDIYTKVSNKAGLKFRAGDVLYGKLRPYLKNWLLPSFSGLAVGDFWVLQPQNIDSRFLYSLIQSDRFDEVANQSTGTKMPRADWNLVSKTEFAIPSSMKEQGQIGQFLLDLDNLITLHQRKYDKLMNIKKSMLEKMFPRDGANVPEIRFAGFTDAWEQRKLSDYLTTSPGKNISGLYTKEDVLSVSGDVGIVNQIEFQGRSFAGASVLNYGIVETGDVVYTKSPLRSNPYGIIKANKGKPGIVSTLYAIYHPSPLADPDFIQCYFEQDARVNNYLHPLVNKGAKNDMKVSADNALKGIVHFPSVKEQQTISAFFKSLDDIITLHQREWEKLRNIKQSCLEKMFV